MIGRIVLAVIAWRISRRLLLVAILVALLAAATSALRDHQPHQAHRRHQTTIEQLLTPIERDIAQAVREATSR